MWRHGLALLLVLSAGCGGDDSDGGAVVVTLRDPPGSIPWEAPPDPADAAAALFDEREFNDVHLSMSPDAWDSIVHDTAGNVWREASFRWKALEVDRIGVRGSRGGGAPGNPKVPLILKFDAFVPGQTFLGLRMLRLDGLLNDPSLIRERLSYGIFRTRMRAPRAAHGRVYLNGEYRGVYEVEEMVDDVFLRTRFDQDGDLYYVDVPISTPDRDPYAWYGDVSDYVPRLWGPVVHVDGDDPLHVLRFVDVVNHDPESLESVCDRSAMLEYFAVEAVVADAHGFAGDRLANNHFQYRRTDTGRFHMIPVDVDDAWGCVDESSPTRSIFMNFQRSRFSALIEDDDFLRAQYKARIRRVMETYPLAQVLAQIDFMYDQIRDAVLADPYKRWTNPDFLRNQDLMKNFAVERYAYLERVLAEE